MRLLLLLALLFLGSMNMSAQDSEPSLCKAVIRSLISDVQEFPANEKVVTSIANDICPKPKPEPKREPDYARRATPVKGQSGETY